MPPYPYFLLGAAIMVPAIVVAFRKLIDARDVEDRQNTIHWLVFACGSFAVFFPLIGIGPKWMPPRGFFLPWIGTIWFGGYLAIWCPFCVFLRWALGARRMPVFLAAPWWMLRLEKDRR